MHLVQTENWSSQRIDGSIHYPVAIWNYRRSQSLQESIQVVFMQYGVGIHIRVIDIIVLKGFIGITDIAICFRFWSWSERFSSTSLFCCLFTRRTPNSNLFTRRFMSCAARILFDGTRRVAPFHWCWYDPRQKCFQPLIRCVIAYRFPFVGYPFYTTELQFCLQSILCDIFGAIIHDWLSKLHM